VQTINCTGFGCSLSRKRLPIPLGGRFFCAGVVFYGLAGPLNGRSRLKARESNPVLLAAQGDLESGIARLLRGCSMEAYPNKLIDHHDRSLWQGDRESMGLGRAGFSRHCSLHCSCIGDHLCRTCEAAAHLGVAAAARGVTPVAALGNPWRRRKTRQQAWPLVRPAPPLLSVTPNISAS
jgi:hypothetical protein